MIDYLIEEFNKFKECSDFTSCAKVIISNEIIIILLVLLIIIFSFWRITKSFCKVFKNVHFCFLFVAFVMIIAQLLIIYKDLTDLPVVKLVLLISGLISGGILVIQFGARDRAVKKTKGDSDYPVLLGIFILLQSAISMKISGSNSLEYNITITHGVIYIALPAFLIFEITNTSKDLNRISDDIKRVSEKSQKIYDELVFNKKNYKECKIKSLFKAKK